MNTSNDSLQTPNPEVKRGVPRPLDKFPRQDPEIPLEVSSEILTNPKAKNSATFRRTMLRSRARVITLPVTAAKPYAVRVGNFSVSRSAVQLSRLLRRLPPRIRALEREHARLEGAKDFRLLQRKDAVELALLDARKHLTALQNEASRRIMSSALTTA